MKNSEIQTRPCPTCPVCASPGHCLYTGLTDRIFNAPGVWDMRKCDKPDCGTLWLDPMPEEAELPKFYAGYYTHIAAELRKRRNLPQRLLDRIRAAYLYTRYGYGPHTRSLTGRLLGWIAYIHPGWRGGVDASVFYLRAKPGGRLLEIGCGSGATLQSMQQKDWQVTGLDFDENAVSNARSKGLDVRHGQLSEQGFADESFDAVVMSHVIEHVPAPDQLLAECHRILKRDGGLVVITPNADSLLHRRYARHWRGLEPPRHLQIFTLKSLASMAGSTGYVGIETFTSVNGRGYIDLASKELAAGKKHVMGVPPPLSRRFADHVTALGFAWSRLGRGYKSDGEEVVLVCRK